MSQKSSIYSFLKRTVSLLITKKMLFKMEPFLRKCYTINKHGSKHECVICDFQSKEWVLLENKDYLCPNCGSLSRDRRLWDIISTKYLKNSLFVLDFSPSRSLYRKWKKQKNIHYTATDLSGNFIADAKYDITSIDKEDNSFDLIICYHILEHIIDDEKAMSELYRVLKPNGTLLIQTPFKEGEIYEDYSITTEAERLKHFGQEDHVRIYSINGLKDRLQNVGFKIEILQFQEEDYFGFSDNEQLIIAKKE